MSESDEQLFEQLGQNIFSSSLMNDNSVPIDFRQLNIFGNLDDDDEVMDEDDDNNTTSQVKFFYSSTNYSSKERRMFEGILRNFPSSDSSSTNTATATNHLDSLSINVNPWGDSKTSTEYIMEQRQQQQQPHQHQQLNHSKPENPFIDNFHNKSNAENDDGFQFANFADFDKFCDNNFSSSFGEIDKDKDEVFMTEMNSDTNANIATKDMNQVKAPESDVAAADTPSNAAFPSANQISNDDTLDLDCSDGLLNGTYDSSEDNIETNFNM